MQVCVPHRYFTMEDDRGRVRKAAVATVQSMLSQFDAQELELHADKDRLMPASHTAHYCVPLDSDCHVCHSVCPAPSVTFPTLQHTRSFSPTLVMLHISIFPPNNALLMMSHLRWQLF